MLPALPVLAAAQILFAIADHPVPQDQVLSVARVRMEELALVTELA